MNLLLSTQVQETDQRLELRTVDLPSDLALIWKWWNAPHVLGKWSMVSRLGPLSDEKKSYSENDLNNYLAENLRPGSKLTPIIVELQGQAVGYIEEYQVGESALSGHPNLSLDDRGLHVMIGEEKYLGQKLPHLLRPLIMEWQFRSYPKANKIVLEPDIKNSIAIQTAMKLSGSKRLPNVEMKHKEAALIVFERPSNSMH